MKELEGQELAGFIRSNEVAVIDFYADWCGPCHMMKPVMEEISEELDGKAGVAKANVDNNREHAQKYGIMSIPTIIIFKKGEPVERITGVMPKKMIMEKIRKFI